MKIPSHARRSPAISAFPPFASRRSARIAAALALLAALPLIASTLDPSGDLDTTFNSAGTKTGIPGEAQFNYATVTVPSDSRAIVAQPGGKVVVGGGSNVNGLYKDYLILRLDAAGKPDPTFGVGGYTTTDMGFDDHINALAINAAGTRICGGGISSVNFGVACYTANGQLDTSFNGNGTSKSNAPNGGVGRIEGMTFDRQGRLIVVGWADISGGTRDWIIRRYAADGTPDTSFNPSGSSGANGTKSWIILDWGGTDRAFDVAILNDPADITKDRIVVVGTSQNNAGAIAILNDNGSLNTANNGLTGTTGKFTGTPGGTTQFRGIAVEQDPSKPHLVVTGQGNGFYLARYSLELPAVAATVTANLATGGDVGYRVRLGADGSVFASGTANSGTDFNIAHLSANLSSVIHATPVDFSGNDLGYDLAVDANGVVTATGFSSGTDPDSIVATRIKADGTLDTTFATSGKFQAKIVGGSVDTPNAFAVQSDGKTVVTGYTFNGDGDYDLATMRVNTDGTLDTAFGTSGWNVLNVTPRTPGGSGTPPSPPPTPGSADFGNAVAIDGSGRAVVVGTTSGPSINGFAVLRYTTAGALDTTFNTTGKLFDNWGANSEGTAVAIQSDGKIVVGGDVAGNAGTFAFARYTAAGVLDTTFNSTGKATVDLGTADQLKAMALDPAGKIVAAGSCVVGGVFKMCLARLTTAGALDATFGSGGKVVVNNLAFDDNNNDSFDVRSMQILPDLDSSVAGAYKIVLGGQVTVLTGPTATATSKANWLLARLTMSGALDTTFNATGVKELDPVAAGYVGGLNSIALQYDEKIVAFGQSAQPDAANPGFFLQRQITVGRFNWDGSLDTTYGSNGWRLATFGSDPGEAYFGYVYPQSSALKGRAVAASFIINGDYALTRYREDPAPLQVPSAPDLIAADDSGRSNSDNITKVTTPTFGGTCGVGETVYVLVNAAQTTPRSRAVCDASGHYSVKLAVAQSGNPATTYQITAMSRSGIGDSAASGALALTIDTVVAAPVIGSPAAGANVLPHPTVSGSGEAFADVPVPDNAPGSGCASPNYADASGNWSCASTFEQGAHTIAVTQTDLAGNVSAAASRSFNVKIPTTTAIVASANPTVYGQTVTFTAQVTPNGSYTAFQPLQGTTIRFQVDGIDQATPTLDASGKATYTTTALSVGSHTVNAIYGENAYWFGSDTSAAPVTHVVQKADSATALASSANPSVFGQSVTFTATISAVAPGAGTPTGTVTFLDGGGSIGTGTLSGGKATFTASALAVGNHTITATYAGDGNFNGSGGALAGNPQIVNKANVATTVASSKNPSLVNQSVTFTANVSAASPGAGTPTGTVTFLDAGNPIGSGTLSGGAATFSTSSLTPGNHTITTSYAGDGNFNTGTGSLSGNPQVVNKMDAATALASSQNPAVFGASVTFTATLTVVAPGTGTPTGTVTFLDGGNNIGTGTLSGGVATLTTASLTAGNHVITSSYGGDADFNTGTGTMSGNPQVITQPDLTIAKTHVGNFTQGQTGATYTLTAGNAGNAPTSGTVSVADTLPAGLAATAIGGTGWSCTLGTLTCTRSDALAAGGSYAAITLTVDVAANAPASLVNSATVSGGGESNTANDSANDTTAINQLPDLTIAKTHGGDFTQGQAGATYALTVSNGGFGPTSGTVTVVDTLPAGLVATAIGGTGWACTPATLTCTRSDALAAGSSYPAITVTVNVANNAPASVTNVASVSGGGETNAGNDSASDPTTIVPLVPDLTISKTHTGNFIQGQTGATYTITVSDVGTGPTAGTATATDTLPAGLTATAIGGTGWACTLGTLTCTRSDALAAGGSYPAITLTVDVANDAAAAVTNSASVSGGGETNTANNTANDATTIVPFVPDLAITKTHAGNFAQGQSGTYTLTVSNLGPAPTSGTVTVDDPVPAGLSIASIVSGNEWNCASSTPTHLVCTTSTALAGGGSYSAIVLHVDVANNAPASLTNTASISGGGETNTANDSASDPTTVVQLPDLTIAKTHVGNFILGQTGATYTLTASNVGSAPTGGAVSVTDTLPAGLTASAIGGAGWACTLGTLTCTRSDALVAGDSYPAITVTVNVAGNAPASVTNTASVSGGGETNTSNDDASDATTVTPALSLETSSGSAAFVAGDNIASTPVAVDPGLTVTANASPVVASATVAITGAFHSGEDVLAFANDGATMGDIAAGYDAATGVLTLTSAGPTATAAQWQSALRSVTYTDTAITPDDATRTLSFSAVDSLGNASNTATRTVSVTDTDQTPIVTTSSGATLYTPGAAAVVVDPSVTVSDLDNATQASGTAAVTSGFHSGDVLSFNNTDPALFGNIAGAYDAGTGVLTLTSVPATATDTQWANAFAAVTFSGTVAGSRTIAFVVSDGTKDSAAATKSIAMAAPTIMLTPTTLSGGTYGHAYGAVDFAASGGIAPYAFAVTGGSTPAGLSLSGNTLSGTPGSVGSFNFTVTATDANGYTGSQSYTLIVAKATLTVTADDKSRSYGAADPAFTWTPSGFVNGDMAAVLSGAPVLGSTDTAASDVGTTYPITIAQGTLAATNYDFAFVNGTLSITGQAGQTITFTSTPPADAMVTGTYAVAATGGASGNPVTFSIDAASTAGACTISADNVSFTGAGTCIVDANQAGDTNYAAAIQAQQVIAVGKKTTTVTLTATPNPVNSGTPVSLVATVAGDPPTGTVSFSDNGSTLPCSPVTLVVGVTSSTATCPAIFATQGAHSITAIYSGDASFAQTTSSILAITVNATAAPAVPAPMLNRWTLLLLCGLFGAMGFAGLRKTS